MKNQTPLQSVIARHREIAKRFKNVYNTDKMRPYYMGQMFRDFATLLSFSESFIGAMVDTELAMNAEPEPTPEIQVISEQNSIVN